MRIRLTMKVPVNLPGLEKGTEHEVTSVEENAGRGRNGWWIRSDGDPLLVLSHEAEIVHD